ncbi:MAG: hypothetical protein V4616_10475, partial [Bacteroidota bacterium]
RLPEGEKWIYSSTSQTVQYAGSYAVNTKRMHYVVLDFYDRDAGKQFALIYNYRDKKLYKTAWFAGYTEQARKLLKVRFVNRRVKISPIDPDERPERIRLSIAEAPV